MTNLNLEHLAKFLVIAKKASYASEQSIIKILPPERPGHKEYFMNNGDFSYRDSYVGSQLFVGCEEVRLVRSQETIWGMVYAGGILPEFQNNKKTSEGAFSFLRQVLRLVCEDIPFRGPPEFTKRENPLWRYENIFDGKIKRFSGFESVFYLGKRVFTLNYAGGLVKEL